MTDRQMEALLAKLLDEDITSAEVDQLLAAVKQSEQQHDELMSHLLLWDIFEQSGCPERSAHAFVEACRIRLSIKDDFTKQVKQRIMDIETSTGAGRRSKRVAVRQHRAKDLTDGIHQFIDRGRSLLQPLRLAAICIAALVLLAGYHVYIRTQPTVAVLNKTLQAHWSGDTPGKRIPAGPLALERGFAHLTLRSGVEAIVEGPACLVLDSPQQITLQQGKLTAKVNPEAVGFTVNTPSGAVVDLGTRFGVSTMSNGQSEVVVFEGKVALRGRGGGSRIINEQQYSGLSEKGKLKPIQSLPDHHNYYMGWEQVQTLPQVWGQCRGVRYFLAKKSGSIPHVRHDVMTLIPEQRNMSLASDLSGIATVPGFYDGFDLQGKADGTVAKGTQVDSYLVLIGPRPDKRQTVYVCTIRFPRKIIGVLSGPQRLKLSDSPREPLVSWYQEFTEQQRVLEMLDTFVINKDGTTLSVTLTVEKRMNQFRILTAAQ